jgi:hypothetical protein
VRADDGKAAVLAAVRALLAHKTLQAGDRMTVTTADE